MSASTPLFESEIEQDEQIYDSSSLSGNIGSSNNNKSKGNARAPKPVEVLEPGSGGSASGNLGVAEMGGIVSAPPLAARGQNLVMDMLERRS